MLGGLLYLGAGLALSAFGLASPGRERREAKFRRQDLPALTAVIVTGGVVAPFLLLWGLERLSGLVGSLLLNLEAPATMAVALLLFREHLGRRELLACGLVVAAGAALSVSPGPVEADPLGATAIAGACLLWAFDNNLSQRLSLRDPVALVRLKGLSAGAGLLVASWLMGHRLPGLSLLVAALALGAVSYGASLLLDLHALRLLGAAREAAFFATAPFVGAALSLPILGERVRLLDGIAAGAMALGVLVLLRERHAHEHTHDELEHDHVHVHDEHHRHEHEGPLVGPHSHPHRHPPFTHDHPHVSDLHHRHRH